MTKTHNGIEYKGGEKVYATGTASGGLMRGTIVGFTKGGQFRVKIDETSNCRAGETVRTYWVSPRD